MSVNEIKDLSVKTFVKELDFIRKIVIIQWNARKKKNKKKKVRKNTWSSQC